jgi:predicted DNA binding protein
LREVVLSLKAPRSWITDIATNFPANLTILDCKNSPVSGLQQLVEVNAPEEHMESLVRAISDNPDVKEVYMVPTRRGRMLGSVTARNSGICRAVMDMRLFCRSCLFSSGKKDDGTILWKVALTESTALKDLLKTLAALGVEADIVRLSGMSNEDLTPKQREMIQTAFDRGFFDYPRRSGLKALSRSLRVSPSALSEVLRRAEKKIVGDYLLVHNSRSRKRLASQITET